MVLVTLIPFGSRWNKLGLFFAIFLLVFIGWFGSFEVEETTIMSRASSGFQGVHAGVWMQQITATVASLFIVLKFLN